MADRGALGSDTDDRTRTVGGTTTDHSAGAPSQKEPRGAVPNWPVRGMLMARTTSQLPRMASVIHTRHMGNVISLTDKIERGVRHGAADECWECTKYRMRSGYGRMTHMGTVRLAHRVTWELNFGPIPEGMIVCHHCDNPPCCNPSHLFVGTDGDNQKDKTIKGRARGGGPFGATHHRSKLTQQQVEYIRCLPKGVNWSDLAKSMGVTRQTVAAVARGKQRSRG